MNKYGNEDYETYIEDDEVLAELLMFKELEEYILKLK
jgi:hypothetical protein